MDPTPVIPIRDTPASSPPPPIPRQVTPAVRRQIWMDPGVRQWWLLALLILIIFIGYAGDRLYARYMESKLIYSGITVKAKIIGAENKVGTMPIGPGDLMAMEVAGTGERLQGYLSANSALGNVLTVHLDPADHTNWTDRSEPMPLLDSTLIGMLMLPIIPVVLLVAYLKMRTLLGTWQNGSAAPAVIFDRRQSPIAPMSYTVRASLTSNRQLFTVHVPRRGFALEKGELIWVIVPKKKGRPLAAAWIGNNE